MAASKHGICCLFLCCLFLLGLCPHCIAANLLPVHVCSCVCFEHTCVRTHTHTHTHMHTPPYLLSHADKAQSFILCANGRLGPRRVVRKSSCLDFAGGIHEAAERIDPQLETRLQAVEALILFLCAVFPCICVSAPASCIHLPGMLDSFI